ncbi:cache domain-containing sensor histidine kinase [Cohnella abietis]|uniref:Sensor histidine kinase YesM n=1 Tax=Cohnella abietis TaxID=2507935 RepID=A0A3T1CZJ4_9BACL|nr:histidine kinase [Cohnella abietis]BBI31273.1 sensor histidine kinase YesM [Cohnella abietis]
MSITFPNRLVGILVITVLIPTLLINLFTFTYIKKEMQSDAASWLQGMTRNTGETMDSYIQLLNGITRNPAFDYTLNNILERHLNNQEGQLGYSFEETAQINGSLTMMRETDRNKIVSIEIYDRNGNRFLLGNRSGGTNSDWIEKTKELEGATYLLPPFQGEDGRPVSAISRMLYNPQTFHEVGMIRMFYRLDFSLEPDSDLLSRGGNLYLVDDQGQVIFDLQQKCLGWKLSSCVGSDHFQSSYVSAITKWTLVTAMPKDQLFIKVNQTQKVILVINLFFFIIALFIIVSVSYRMSSPIKRLSRLMLTAPKHHFNIDIPDTKRTDEIGIMTTSLQYMVDHIHELIAEVMSIEQRRKTSEIASLQAQINPHFLYNTLSMIVMQAEIDGNYNISTMGSKLGRLLRYSIGKEKEWVNVQKECEHIGLYMEVMKFRYPKLVLELQIDDKVLNWRMIKLLLQPIVENAIIHGIVPNGQEGTIRIEMKELHINGDERLLIRIQDNGIGMEVDQLQDIKDSLIGMGGLTKESIGIRNVYERIHLAYTKGRVHFDIESSIGQGTIYTIELPKVADEVIDRR